MFSGLKSNTAKPFLAPSTTVGGLLDVKKYLPSFVLPFHSLGLSPFLPLKSLASAHNWIPTIGKPWIGASALGGGGTNAGWLESKLGCKPHLVAK